MVTLSVAGREEDWESSADSVRLRLVLRVRVGLERETVTVMVVVGGGLRVAVCGDMVGVVLGVPVGGGLGVLDLDSVALWLAVGVWLEERVAV